MKYCTQCGGQNQDTAQFCTACGTRVEAPAPPDSPVPKRTGAATSSEEGIKFACPECGQSLEAPREMAGSRIECPTCQQPVDILMPQRAQAGEIAQDVSAIEPPPLPAERPSANIPAPPPLGKAPPRRRVLLPLFVAASMLGVLLLVGALAYAVFVYANSATVTTVAGKALASHDGSPNADGRGKTARFDSPAGIAVDRNGNLYIADSGTSVNWAIRKITPDGMVATLAHLTCSPGGVAVDGSGNVYVAETDNALIRQISPDGTMRIVGRPGVHGHQDGVGPEALFDSPHGLAMDTRGNLYVTDSKSRTIRKITPDGVVTTLAGNPGGREESVDGAGSAARFAGPYAIAGDGSGTVYVTDGRTWASIRKITPGGAVTTIAGGASKTGISEPIDGLRTADRDYEPSALAVDEAGNVYVADGTSVIRKIAPDGKVTVLAGKPRVWGSADGIGRFARFVLPRGLALDGRGNLYVADTGNHTIRKIKLGMAGR